MEANEGRCVHHVNLCRGAAALNRTLEGAGSRGMRGRRGKSGDPGRNCQLAKMISISVLHGASLRLCAFSGSRKCFLIRANLESQRNDESNDRDRSIWSFACSTQCRVFESCFWTSKSTLSLANGTSKIENQNFESSNFLGLFSMKTPRWNRYVFSFDFPFSVSFAIVALDVMQSAQKHIATSRFAMDPRYRQRSTLSLSRRQVGF